MVSQANRLMESWVNIRADSIMFVLNTLHKSFHTFPFWLLAPLLMIFNPRNMANIPVVKNHTRLARKQISYL